MTNQPSEQRITRYPIVTYNTLQEAEILKKVVKLRTKYSEKWRDKSDSYWLARLMQEVGELGSSLVKDHEDTPEWELEQIASIALNWLEKRQP